MFISTGFFLIVNLAGFKVYNQSLVLGSSLHVYLFLSASSCCFSIIPTVVSHIMCSLVVSHGSEWTLSHLQFPLSQDFTSSFLVVLLATKFSSDTSSQLRLWLSSIPRFTQTGECPQANVCCKS